MSVKEIASKIENFLYELDPKVLNQLMNSEEFKSYSKTVGVNPNASNNGNCLGHILPSCSVGEPLQNKAPENVSPSAVPNLHELFKEPGECGSTNNNTDDKGFGGGSVPPRTIFGDPVERPQYDKGVNTKPKEEFPGGGVHKQIGKCREL